MNGEMSSFNEYLSKEMTKDVRRIMDDLKDPDKIAKKKLTKSREDIKEEKNEFFN